MINLITGVPGAGKTCYALTFMQKQTKQGRQLFVHGIPELKIPHIDVYCTSPNCDVCTHYTEEEKTKMFQADLWDEWAPDGAVLFYDEVQNVYRPRSSGSKVPKSIQAFEVHRHRGLDFYLISQSPKLFDSNIRELISRHIHLKSNWAGRFQYEWPECKQNVQSTSDAIRSSYKLDSNMFKLYKSASLHTKQERKLPVAVYVFIACMLVVLYGGYRVYSRVSGAINGEGGYVPSTIKEEDSENKSSFSAVNESTNNSKQNNNSLPDKFNFSPTVKGVLESAPAYSNLVQVKDFPRITACITNNEKCTCYTQQMTIYPTTPKACLAFINGDVQSFNPFIEPPKPQQVISQQKLDT